MKVRVTVLVADLVGWTRLARKLQQNLDVDAVTRLNTQVRALVEDALTAGSGGLGPPREFDGDGVTVFFDHPPAAHDFAIALNRAAEAHNRERSDPDAQRHFRVGIATGELDRVDGDGPPNFEGAIRSDAVRLCAAADPGQVVADLPTIEGLSGPARNLYLGEEVVRGKRDDETFRVRRCLAGAVGLAANNAAPARRSRWVAAVVPLLLVAIVAGLALPWVGCARPTDTRVGGDGGGAIVGDGNTGNTVIGPGAIVQINPPPPKKPDDEYTTHRDGAGSMLMKVADSSKWIGAILGGETEHAVGRLANGTRVRLIEQPPAAPDDQPWAKVVVLEGPLNGTTGWVVRSDLRR